jgi:type I restriction enzyme M protein
VRCGHPKCMPGISVGAVPNSEIAEQDYNLSVSTYVEQEDTREKIDIVALNAEIEKIVAREQVLREEIDKIIAEIEVGK